MTNSGFEAFPNDIKRIPQNQMPLRPHPTSGHFPQPVIQLQYPGHTSIHQYPVAPQIIVQQYYLPPILIAPQFPGHQVMRPMPSVVTHNTHAPNFAPAHNAQYSLPPPSSVIHSEPPPPRDAYHFTEEQRKGLEKSYKQKKFPTKVEKELLAQKLGLTKKQVENWYSKTRAQDKKRGNNMNI